MGKFRVTALLRLMLLALTISPPPVSARPYTVDDLLETEAFGQILVAPGGRWLVFEQQRSLASSPRFHELSMDAIRGRIYRVDLRAPAAAEPLLSLPPSTGQLVYGFSPNGTRLAVARLDGETWRLGIVTLATGAVRWFALSPDYYPSRTTLGWVSEDRLVVIAQIGDRLPWIFRSNLDDAIALPAAWAAKQQGQSPTVTAIGSGREIDQTPTPPATQLVDLNLLTGTQRVLARGNLQSLSISPDGRSLALIQETDRIRISVAPPLNGATDVRRRRLSIVDLADGATWQPCATCDVPYHPPAWSPSGSKLLFYARSPGQTWEQGGPWLADMAAATGQPIALGGLRPVVTQSFGDYDSVGLGWVGAMPMLFANREDGSSRRDWYRLGTGRVEALTAGVPVTSPRLITGIYGAPIMLVGSEAWRIDSNGARKLLPRMTTVIPTPISTPAAGRQGGRRPVFGWRDSDRGRVMALDDDRNGDLLLEDKGGLQPETASAEQGAVVATRTGDTGMTDLVVQTRRAPPRTVASINRHLEMVAAVAPMPIRHRLPDGRAAISWLYLPAPREDGSKPGLITIPYAGRVFGDTPPRGWGNGDGRTYASAAALVGHGYAVLLPSMPELAARDDTPFDHAGQVLSAVDAVIATGRVDPDRLGLWGHSFGGYTAATIATETDRFRAIVASDGVYDLTSFQGSFAPAVRMTPGYNEGMIRWAGWTETGQPKLGATPWSNPARYIANSPIHHADRIVTPVMIIAADRDFVPLQQGEQLFSALYRQGKDAVLLSYWGEEHTLVSPANLRDCYARVFTWFDRYLGASRPSP